MVVNEFKLGYGRPAPGCGRLRAVELSAWTVRDPTYSNSMDVVLVTGFWTAMFHTSLYSTEKLWLTSFAPLAALGLKLKIWFILQGGVPHVPVLCLTVLFRTHARVSAR